MIAYICQCHFLTSSYLPPPMSPQVWSLHLHLYSFIENRFINTIFLDCIYVHQCMIFVFFLWLSSLCITGSRFINFTTAGLNLLLFYGRTIFHRIYVPPFFSCSSVKGSLDHCHALVIANSTAVNIFIPRSEVIIYPYRILMDIANLPPKRLYQVEPQR